jgi:hypothetical protein
MDIDANRSKGHTPVVCYHCGQPGHIKSDPKCPLKHDVQALDTDELQSILEDRLAQLDVIRTIPRMSVRPKWRRRLRIFMPTTSEQHTLVVK